jgi:hypothetical protein
MTKKILLAFIFPMLFGCEKSMITSEIVTQGKWVITNYSEGKTDYASLFVNYEFVFAQGNIINITKDKTIFYETWLANSSADGTRNFELVMQSPGLKRINGIWKITDINTSAISLYIGNDSANLVRKLIFESL